MATKSLRKRWGLAVAAMAVTFVAGDRALAGPGLNLGPHTGWSAQSAAHGAALPAVSSLDAAAEPAEPVIRVRGLKDGRLDAGRMLADGMRQSPTIKSLVSALEKTDVMVHVELKAGVPGGTGLTRLISTAGGYRHLLVSIELRNPVHERYAWLGHELRHALEIAAAPEVRDTPSLERLYRRIGTPTADGWFETDAAVASGLAVSAEVRGIAAPKR